METRGLSSGTGSPRHPSACVNRLSFLVTITIISPESLKQQCAAERNRPIVIDARPIEEYTAGHIPGAIHMAWSAWCAVPPDGASDELRQPGYWGSLADHSLGWVEEQLGAHGISSDHPIVVYADGVHSRGREGRIAWMLLYFGACRVSLLDGGLQGWLETGGTLDTALPRLEPQRFCVDVQIERRWTLLTDPDLDGEDGAPLLVDTRSPAEFEGQAYRYQPRMGHLPSAVLVPFDSLFHASGRYVALDTYRERIASNVEGASCLVAYCEVGVRACTFALLHEAYTGEIVSVYDGSIMEWGLYPELSVVSGR